MGRKRRHVFLTPTLAHLSNQLPDLGLSKGEESNSLTRYSYPTKVSSDHRTHKTRICPAFSLWTRFPPRPQQGGATALSVSKTS